MQRKSSKLTALLLALVMTLALLPATASAAAGGIPYSNGKLNFSLTLPASWAGLYRADERPDGVSFIDARNDKAGYGGFVFGIIVSNDRSPEEWTGVLLTQSSGKYYYITTPSDVQYKYDDASLSKEYTAMQKDIASIKATFSLGTAASDALPPLPDPPGNLTVNIQIERDGYDYLTFSYTVPDSVKDVPDVDFRLEMRVNGGDWITADSDNPEYNLDPMFIESAPGWLTGAFYHNEKQQNLALDKNSYEFRSCFAIGNQEGSPYSNTVSLGKVRGGVSGTIQMTVNSKTMTVNSKSQAVDPGYNTAPVIINGRTMVPIRAVVEAMGGSVGWDGGSRQVTLNANGIAVVMWVGDTNYYVNGTQKTMDTAPVIVGGRTLIPVRFAAEALGCKVDWNPDTQGIVITYGKAG